MKGRKRPRAAQEGTRRVPRASGGRVKPKAPAKPKEHK